MLSARYSMSYQHIDLFQLMGIEPEEPIGKKSNKKQATQKNGKNKAASKSDENVKLPVTVYTGYHLPIILKPEDFSGKEEITLKEAQERMANIMDDYPVGISAIQKGKKGLYLIHKDAYMVEKTSIHIKQTTKLMLAGTNIDISAIKTDEGSDVECSKLKEIFAFSFRDYGEVGFIHSATADVIIPSFTFPRLQSPISLPVKIGIFGREEYTITNAEYKALNENDNTTVDEENGHDVNVEDTDGKGEKQDTETTIPIDTLEKMIIQKYPDFDEGHLELQWNDKAKMVVVKMCEKKEKSKTPSEETYPTDAMLSLIYTKWRLSPDMFGGKDRVGQEELRQYVAKDRPEYSKDRTSIQYDKDNNLIIMVCTGSRKGAVISDDEKAMELISSDEDVLFDWQKSTGLYRVEKSRAYLIIAPKHSIENGEFKLFLPKVPLYMYYIADSFFKYISEEYGTEAMLQLFWDEENKRYFWYLPNQIVSPTTCDVERNIDVEMRYLLVGDFHSHGSLPAFFSARDDRDEKGFRLYGVFGNYNSDGKDADFLLRAGTGGYFLFLNREDVFDVMDEKETKEIAQTLEQLIEDAEEMIGFAY